MIIGVHLIPTHSIIENVKTSSILLEKEGAYKEIANFKLFQLDNYTDALMLNIAASVNSEHPIDAAMLNRYHWNGDCMGMAKSNLLYLSGNTKDLEQLIYGRYWHGYQIYLRPLLTIMDYQEIRIANYICLCGLLLSILALLWKKIGKSPCIIFAISLLIINFPIVPLSMQFSTCFYIAFLGMICILQWPKFTQKTENMLATFFCLGSFCAFFDLLTTPQLTLGLPLITMLLLQKKNKKWKLVITSSIAWALGYGLLWMSKWVIAFIFTGQNIILDALHQASLRTNGLYKGMELTIPNIANFIWDNISEKGLQWIIWGALVMLFVLFAIYYKHQKGIERQKDWCWLLIIMGIVPIWFLFLREHSIQHGWFTWRAGLLCIFSLLLWIYYTTIINIDIKQHHFYGKE